MGTSLASIEPIQPPSAQHLERLSSLPQWVAERLAILRNESQPDQAGKYRMVPVLPAALILSAEQRVLAHEHITGLSIMLDMTPMNGSAHAQQTMLVVSKMLLTLPSREAGELAAEAKGEAFMEALDDVPCWAVKEAMRRWHRGEHGDSHDYRWQPAPATLRRLARIEELRVKGLRGRLIDICAAESEIQFSEEHRTSMKERMAGLAKSLFGKATGERIQSNEDAA